MKKTLITLLFSLVACVTFADTPTKLSLVIQTSFKTTFSIQSPVNESFSLSGYKKLDYDSFLSLGTGIMLVGTITVDRAAKLEISYYPYSSSSATAVYTRKLSKGQNVITGDFIEYAPTTTTKATFYITVTYNN